MTVTSPLPHGLEENSPQHSLNITWASGCGERSELLALPFPPSRYLLLRVPRHTGGKQRDSIGKADATVKYRNMTT